MITVIALWEGPTSKSLPLGFVCRQVKQVRVPSYTLGHPLGRGIELVRDKLAECVDCGIVDSLYFGCI